VSSQRKPRETVQSFDNGQRSYSFQDIFAEGLSVNDRLRKVLADVETAALTETDASTTAASAPCTGICPRAINLRIYYLEMIF
jgi:hypothetical protein